MKILKRKKNKKGIAVIEFLFCFFVFVFMLAVLYGAWGVIHSSILNSIAARTYAFSVIRNRSNVRFIKDNSSALIGYFDRETRFFGVTTYQPGLNPDWIAPSVSIDFMPGKSDARENAGKSGFVGMDVKGRSKERSEWIGGNLGELQLPAKQSASNLRTTQVFLKQGYGICLSADCNTP